MSSIKLELELGLRESSSESNYFDYVEQKMNRDDDGRVVVNPKKPDINVLDLSLEDDTPAGADRAGQPKG
ncbi:MAG: hypothetical protein AAF465_07080 [Pseudomonadota bacterium]